MEKVETCFSSQNQNWDFIMLYLKLQRISPEKLKLTVVEMQQLPHIEKTDSKEKTRLKWTTYNGRRKVYVNFQTDSGKLNIVVYRYRNSL